MSQRFDRYEPGFKLHPHQTKALELSAGKPAYAFLLEMGLGKTVIAIAEIGQLYAAGEIDAAVIIAPKSLIAQWQEELRTHLDPRAKRIPVYYSSVESLAGKGHAEKVADFCDEHARHVMMVVDESQTIKNHRAKRTRAVMGLASFARFRRIMTGTPIGNSLMDCWSQFAFLNPSITRHSNPFTFQSEFCITSAVNRHHIIASRNHEVLYERIAPYSYRLTKAEALDLPPKMYSEARYIVEPETRRAYDQMRDEMRVLLDSGEEVEVTTVLTQMLRLQQIVCGYITKDGEVVDVGSSDRLEALDNVLEQVSGPSVIWCRFRPDVVKVAAHLDNPSKVIETLTGDTTPTDVRRIAERFRKGEVDFLVATQAKASRGLNLQGSSLNAIYYSQSFSAEQRWQSEDRLHRIGVNGTVMCHDIIAERTIDNHIVRALKRKKSLSDMTLDDLRKVLD